MAALAAGVACPPKLVRLAAALAGALIAPRALAQPSVALNKIALPPPVPIGLAVAAGDKLVLRLGDNGLPYEPYGFALRRNDADFKQAVNRVLAQLYRTGEIAPIYERWFGRLGKPGPLLAAMFTLSALPE